MHLRKDLQQVYSSSSYFENICKLLGLHGCIKMLPLRLGHLQTFCPVYPEVFKLTRNITSYMMRRIVTISRLL